MRGKIATLRNQELKRHASNWKEKEDQELRKSGKNRSKGEFFFASLASFARV